MIRRLIVHTPRLIVLPGNPAAHICLLNSKCEHHEAKKSIAAAPSEKEASHGNRCHREEEYAPAKVKSP
jgi:hypothetical protein